MWNKLSMADRAKVIQLGVKSGITDLNTIKQYYNTFAKGGYKDSTESPNQTYQRREDLEQSLQQEYPYLYDNYPVNIIQDNTFNSGHGDIEAMLGEDAYYPESGYTYKNPYEGQNTIVFNDKVKNPKIATQLDYLHVLRKEDPTYQSLLRNLDAAADDTDIIYGAKQRYEEDKKANNGVEVMPFNRYVENEEDGWLRNMFHPGTKEELEQDNYYPDRQQLLEWNAPLQEPTREIYNYLHPYPLSEVTVSPQSNEFRAGGLLTNKQLLAKLEKLGHKGYIKDGMLRTMAGTPLVYNYQKDRFEFKNSAGDPFMMTPNGKFAKFVDVPSKKGGKSKNNSYRRKKALLDYPYTYQAMSADEHFTKQRDKINNSRQIDFIGEKEHKIQKGKDKGVSISTNYVDSVKANLNNREAQAKFLGISSRETGSGNYPPYYFAPTVNSKPNNTFKYDKKTTPTSLSNDHNYYISPIRGALNTLYKIPSSNPLVYGSPGFYYSADDLAEAIIRAGQDTDFFNNVESTLKYDVSKGKYDPDKKRVTKNKKGKVIDYYNPEDNPYVHAVEALNEFNYGMGKNYPNQVAKDAESLKYLLNGQK